MSCRSTGMLSVHYTGVHVHDKVCLVLSHISYDFRYLPHHITQHCTCATSALRHCLSKHCKAYHVSIGVRFHTLVAISFSRVAHRGLSLSCASVARRLVRNAKILKLDLQRWVVLSLQTSERGAGTPSVCIRRRRR